MVTRTIHGNLSQGRAPHIEFEHARYGGGPLALSYNLIGQRVQLRVNVHDARFGHVFTLRGEPLGRVWAAPPWHRTPHSLRLRALIHQKTYARARHAGRYGDPIAQFAALSEAQLAQGGPATDGYLALQRSLALQASMSDGMPAEHAADGIEAAVPHDDPGVAPAPAPVPSAATPGLPAPRLAAQRKPPVP